MDDFVGSARGQVFAIRRKSQGPDPMFIELAQVLAGCSVPYVDRLITPAGSKNFAVGGVSQAKNAVAVTKAGSAQPMVRAFGQTVARFATLGRRLAISRAGRRTI